MEEQNGSPLETQSNVSSLAWISNPVDNYKKRNIIGIGLIFITLAVIGVISFTWLNTKEISKDVPWLNSAQEVKSQELVTELVETKQKETSFNTGVIQNTSLKKTAWAISWTGSQVSTGMVNQEVKATSENNSSTLKSTNTWELDDNLAMIEIAQCSISVEWGKADYSLVGIIQQRWKEGYEPNCSATGGIDFIKKDITLQERREMERWAQKNYPQSLTNTGDTISIDNKIDIFLSSCHLNSIDKNSLSSQIKQKVSEGYVPQCSATGAVTFVKSTESAFSSQQNTSQVSIPPIQAGSGSGGMNIDDSIKWFLSHCTLPVGKIQSEMIEEIKDKSVHGYIPRCSSTGVLDFYNPREPNQSISWAPNSPKTWTGIQDIEAMMKMFFTYCPLATGVSETEVRAQIKKKVAEGYLPFCTQTGSIDYMQEKVSYPNASLPNNYVPNLPWVKKTIDPNKPLEISTLTEASDKWASWANPTGEIPQSGYKVVYLNTETKKTYEGESANDISIANYKPDNTAFWSTRGANWVINYNFWAYWVGYINISEKDMYQIAVFQSWGNTRVIIDDKLAYSGSYSKGTDITLEKGKHKVEVEFWNHSATIDFSMKIIKKEKAHSNEELTAELKKTTIPSNAEIWYVGVHESDNENQEMKVGLKKTDKPVILILWSISTINWEVNTNNDNVIAVYYASGSPGTTVKWVPSSSVKAITLNPVQLPTRVFPECSDLWNWYHCEERDNFQNLNQFVKTTFGKKLTGFFWEYNPKTIDAPEIILDETKYTEIQKAYEEAKKKTKNPYAIQ